MPNPDDKTGGRILPGLPSVKAPHVQRLTPEEERYQDLILKASDGVLAAVRHLSDLHKLVALKTAVAQVIKTEVAQGMKGAAFKLFVQQLQDTLSQKRGTNTSGLFTPGKIGGGIKR